jgi:hypothetical protein
MSLKLIIKSVAQRQMVEVGFGRRFYGLQYFEVGFFLSLNVNQLNS